MGPARADTKPFDAKEPNFCQHLELLTLAGTHLALEPRPKHGILGEKCSKQRENREKACF